MLVLIKSAPDTSEGRRGVEIARTLHAGLVLLQNGVYFAQKGRLKDFSGAIYMLDDDSRLRGITDIERAVETIDYNRFVDLITSEDKTVGMF